MITTEQFAEWKELEVTKEIFMLLSDARKGLQIRLSEGTTLAQKADVTHGLTHKMVGQIEGLNQLLNISFEGEKVFDDVSDITGH